jgi:hypothetical protein
MRCSAAPRTCAPFYEEISGHAVLTVKSDEMARFWDKRLSPEARAATRFCTRVEGTCIRNHLGLQSLKMYDRDGRILRSEASSNDITFFSHRRKVDHKDCSAEHKVAPLKTSIYSLTDLDGFMAAACRRYLKFIGTLEDHTVQRLALDHISRPRGERDRGWRGFRFSSRKTSWYYSRCFGESSSSTVLADVACANSSPARLRPKSAASKNACVCTVSSGESAAPIATISPASAAAHSSLLAN